MKFICFFSLLLTTASSHAQIITTIAGNGTYGYSGDGGNATSAQLAWCIGVVADNNGNVYIADHDNNVIRKVNSAGIINNFAGIGSTGFSGDGGLATYAELYHPAWIAIDNYDNIFFTDQNAAVIRKVNTAGIISTITGNLPPGYSGDNGPLIAAQFGSLNGISFDNTDNMYISDVQNAVIRKVNSVGTITTIVGNGTAGFSGDGGLASNAQLGGPYSVAFDDAGSMYIPDNGNSRIRKVNTAGIITTIAGNGTLGYSGDGGQATNAQLTYPWTIAIDKLNNIYVGDGGNYTVRKIDPVGIITTFAGNGTYGNSGDGSVATDAELGEVAGVTLDNSGNVYVCIRNYFYVIRKINTCLTASINFQPSNDTLCNSGNTKFIINATNASSYVWQVNSGTGWNNLTDNSIYSGSVTDTLNILGANGTMNNYQYRCIATNTCGNIFSSAATLNITPASIPTLTIVTITDTICAGTNTMFTATPLDGGLSPLFQWKKNGIATGTNTPSYIGNNLNNGDIITCFLTSNSSCVTTDTTTSNPITISVNPVLTPSLTISQSVNNICPGTSVTFTSVSINGGSSPSFQWKKNGVNVGTDSSAYLDNFLNNGDSTTCVVASSYNCLSVPTATSNILVTNVLPSLTPSILISTINTSICPNTPATYFAITTNGGSLPIYQWKKNGLPVGSNSNTYMDQNILDGDIINCSITSNSNCLSTASATSNSISMTVFKNPVVSLDKTTTLCAAGNRILDAGNYNSYLWNDSSSGSTLFVNNPGTYNVTVTDNNGCKGTDTSNITAFLPPVTNFLPIDTAICSYGLLSLTPKAGYRNYLWNNNSIGSTITISQPGLYWLEVTDNNNCKGRDSILVTPKDCMTGFYIPSAFTPNQDGKNDSFKPLLFGDVKKYKFIIYNRFGQTIFQTSDLTRAWFGTIKGVNLDGDVFVWTCAYHFEGQSEEFKKGTVLLIR